MGTSRWATVATTTGTGPPAASARFHSGASAAAQGQQDSGCQGRNSNLRKCFANVHEECSLTTSLHTRLKKGRPRGPKGYQENRIMCKYTFPLRDFWMWMVK